MNYELSSWSCSIVLLYQNKFPLKLVSRFVAFEGLKNLKFLEYVCCYYIASKKSWFLLISNTFFQKIHLKLHPVLKNSKNGSEISISQVEWKWHTLKCKTLLALYFHLTNNIYKFVTLLGLFPSANKTLSVGSFWLN